MQITTQSPNIQIHKHVHGYKCTGFSIFMMENIKIEL
jgi:hypothetical protein